MDTNLQKTPFPKILFTASLLLVITAIIAGIIITGGPLKQRKMRLDEKRVNIIKDLSYKIRDYYKLNSKLPSKLEDISDLRRFIDPRTGKLPDYSIINVTKFKICTNFETSNIDSDISSNNYGRYNYNNSQYIKHPSGYYCVIYSKNEKSNFTTFDLMN